MLACAAQREWDPLWTKIWHVAGRVHELPEAGDYVVHNFMHEFVIVVRQDNRSLRKFYDTCGHRRQRLVSGSSHEGVSLSRASIIQDAKHHAAPIEHIDYVNVPKEFSRLQSLLMKSTLVNENYGQRGAFCHPDHHDCAVQSRRRRVDRHLQPKFR
jgi:hypothetical protein